MRLVNDGIPNNVQSGHLQVQYTLGHGIVAIKNIFINHMQWWQLIHATFFHARKLQIESIDGPYVDGVSVTYGSTPRKHIWTYTSGYLTCPCNTDSTYTSPSYVGNDYYCESLITIAISDPLWNGQQCDGAEAPCCTHPNMPWFNKTLNETTTEDIEVRMCGDQPTSNEDTPLQVIELYVQWAP